MPAMRSSVEKPDVSLRSRQRLRWSSTIAGNHLAAASGLRARSTRTGASPSSCRRRRLISLTIFLPTRFSSPASDPSFARSTYG